MSDLRIFISSVQREFAGERSALRNYLREDPLMRRFFDVFLFGDAPASDQRPDELYLDEMDRCDLYVGLFGIDYGVENEVGLSPTEQEFERAAASGAHRLIFVKGADDSVRHPKMRSLVGKAQSGLIRKRFNTPEELVSGAYAALVEFLESRELIRSGPFDAAHCKDATFRDLDFKRMTRFIRAARKARKFPLAAKATPKELLEHLDLLNRGRLTNAAVLLFGKVPQRFLDSSGVKCVHLHGKKVFKPIPGCEVYRGTTFELVDKAVDFVLSKLSPSVGTRAKSVRAPVAYEFPTEVVTEPVLNAVAHRDYTNNGGVQVMLCSDQLEVWSLGRLPPPLAPRKLRVAHTSVPVNRPIAKSWYLAQCIERMGTGTLDMISRCTDAGLPEPNLSDSGQFVPTAWRTSVVTVRWGEHPVSDANVSMLLPNGTWKQSTASETGEALLETESRSVPSDVLVAATGFTAHLERGWVPAVRPLSLILQNMHGGAAVSTGLTGEVLGVEGLFRLTRGTQGQLHLDAANVSINEGQPLPVQCSLGEELHLMGSDGRELSIRIVDVVRRSAIVRYHASRNQGSPWPESAGSQPESLGTKAVRLLAASPKLEAALSTNLLQKEVSGQPNRVVRQLLAEGMIEYTGPDKLHSCLREYRVTEKGMDAVATLNRGRMEP